MKNKHAQALGRLGGLKGGKARAAALTPERRQEIARNAGKAKGKKGSHEEEARREAKEISDMIIQELLLHK